MVEKDRRDEKVYDRLYSLNKKVKDIMISSNNLNQKEVN